jgi:CYTH domain-containing protein
MIRPASVVFFLSAGLGFFATGLAANPSLAPQSQEDETDAHGYDKVRIEQEDKLFVPADLVDEVWAFLQQRFVEDQAHVLELDPRFSSKWSEELFHDTYFDTPSMQLYAMKSGVRYRHRVNLSDPNDRKSGRELMQIKMNDISSNDLERAEIKFEIERRARPESVEDRHPMLGMVKPDHREPFKKRLVEMGLDPQSMRPVLTVRDVRRRVYLLKDGQPFMSISHDQASSSVWWAHAEFSEIEPELNEIGFTEADPATRAYMETVLHKVVAEILAKFPEIQRDLTPKYNKSFDRLETELPFFRFLVTTGMQSNDYMYLSGGVVVVAAVGAGWLVSRKRRAPARPAARPDVSRVPAA